MVTERASMTSIYPYWFTGLSLHLVSGSSLTNATARMTECMHHMSDTCMWCGAAELHTLGVADGAASLSRRLGSDSTRVEAAVVLRLRRCHDYTCVRCSKHEYFLEQSCPMHMNAPLYGAFWLLLPRFANTQLASPTQTYQGSGLLGINPYAFGILT